MILEASWVVGRGEPILLRFNGLLTHKGAVDAVLSMTDAAGEMVSKSFWSARSD